MSCSKFYFNNLIEEATLTPSTVNALFPVANLKDVRRTKVFRSTANTSHIYFDFGAAEPIDSIVLVGHTLNGLGITSASLELNAVATWTVGAPVTIAITLDNINNIGHGKHTAVVNYRYAKLVMTSTLGYCELSKVFIGTARDIGATQDFAYPLNVSMDNLATISKNRFGQKFIDEVSTQKKFQGDLKTLTNEEIETVYDLVTECSVTKPFFMRLEGVDVFTETNRVNGYYYLKNEPNFKYTSGGFWDCNLDLEEGM